MSEHEDRRVIRRIVAPPTLPIVVRPRSADRSEHVAPYDPRSNVGETARHKVVINAAFSNALTFQLLKSASGNHPVVQLLTADSERIVDILTGAGAVAVQRY